MKNRRDTHHRSSKGFALIAILVFGVFAFSMLFAMFPFIVNVIRSEGSGRSMTELRTAAEIGIDYGMQQLNDNAQNNQGGQSPIDLTSSSPVPAKYLVGFPGGTVRIRIKPLTKADFGSNSTIFSAGLDGSTVSYWRVLESTATRGLFSQSIRVFLEPRFDKSALDLANSPTGTNSSSYFKNALFGKTGIDFSPQSGSLTIRSSTQAPSSPAYTLAVQSTNTNLNGNVSLQGDLRLPQGARASIGPGSAVNGRVVVDPTNLPINGGTFDPRVNGGFDDTVGPNPIMSPNPLVDNVLADSEQAPTRTGDNLLPIDTTTPVAAPDPLAPAPSAGTASPLPTITDGSALPAGSYSTTSLSFSSNSNVATVNAPTKIYVQDGTADLPAATTAVSIQAGSLKTTTTAQNLQIWYSGNRNINIELNPDFPFKSLIYAPNSKITISGSGNFNGALVGKNVVANTKGASTISIETDLQTASGAGAASGSLTYAIDPITREPQLHGYKAMTWQEIPGALVP